MEQFDINKIIEHYKLDIDEVSKVLFPHVKYQKLAFDRVIKGESSLNVDQLIELAKFIGVPVYELFSIDTWKCQKEDNCLVFLKGEFKCKLNHNGVFLTVYKNGKQVAQFIGANSLYTVEEFISYIDTLTKNY